MHEPLALDDPDLIAKLDSPEWLRLAPAYLASGVKEREAGRPNVAYDYYRFVLGVTARHGERAGLEAVTWSIWNLREAIRDATLRGNTPLSPEAREHLNAIGRRMAADAAQCAARFQRDDEDLLASVLHYRLLDLAGNTAARRAALLALCKLASAQDAWPLAVVPILQEIASADKLDLLSEVVAESHRDGSFEEVWANYTTARAHLHAANPADTDRALQAAVDQLEWQRLSATAGGGTFGHRVSYLISSRLQVVARDLVELLGTTNIARSLDVFERARGRALTDWMTRSHGVLRVPRQIRNGALPGSHNATEPVTSEEMRAAARDAGAPIVTYIARQSGYLAIVQTPDGTPVADAIADPHPLLRKLMRNLPYFGRVTRRDDIDTLLRSLHDVLFPAKIRDAIGERGRLVIIPDQGLDFVPFCALRTAKDRYLVEDRDVVYWPSVTAWRTTQLRDMPFAPPRFFGDPELAYALTGADPLKGARMEATQLAARFGTQAILGADATTEAVLGSSGASILHLAMHGMLNEQDPQSSFLALADRKLAARELYERDRTLAARLVMMSACQTALGQPHPDSGIGLANAFLVAGAKSVMSTLWQIPDKATPLLMDELYGAIQNKAPLDAALAQAQRVVLAKHPHPFFWAAFKLTGSMANPT